MRLIRWVGAIVGLFALIPDKTRALVFCLFMALIIGISFLILGMIVAFIRVQDRVNSRDHREG